MVNKPYYVHDGIEIYHADCRVVLPTLQRCDLLLTDPPYGINVTRNGTVGGGGATAKGYRDWPLSAWDTTLQQSALDMALAKSCRAIVWGGNYYALPPSRCWLVWDKGQREFSLADGELAWTNLDNSVRIMTHPRSPREYKAQEHPTQKPLQVIVWSLSQAVQPVSSILDPFMGSGTTLVAAKLRGCRAIGIEANERYCEIAAKRLAQGVLALVGDSPRTDGEP